MTNSSSVHHDAAQGRFELTVDGHSCELLYALTPNLPGQPGLMRIHHTEVPPALGGRGLAALLADAALAHARAQGLRVQPSCSYVRLYMQRHPETLDLLPQP